MVPGYNILKVQFSAHAEQRLQGNVINLNSYHVFDRNCQVPKATAWIQYINGVRFMYSFFRGVDQQTLIN